MMVAENLDTQTLDYISIDYLAIGHLTADLTPQGVRLGGTAAFSGLTAHALGMQTGLLTSCSENLDTSPIDALKIIKKPSHNTTTFKNISDGKTRTQYLYQVAERLSADDIPAFKQAPAIIHLGPVANEVNHEILRRFPHSLKCLTPQGWMRAINSNQQVVRHPWDGYKEALLQADIAVISLDDVQMDEEIIAVMSNEIPIFVVTENKRGARVYWQNDARFFKAPEVEYLDDTGAGDIFAAAFFYRYFYTKDPWEAGRFAVLLASWSVTRSHLDSIPTQEEINSAKIQLIDQ
jgi:sugar/nucleoside kinase (ribokinase family)